MGIAETQAFLERVGYQRGEGEMPAEFFKRAVDQATDAGLPVEIAARAIQTLLTGGRVNTAVKQFSETLQEKLVDVEVPEETTVSRHEEAVVELEIIEPVSHEMVPVSDSMDEPILHEKQAKQRKRDPASRQLAFLNDLGIAQDRELPDEAKGKLSAFMVELYRQVTSSISTDGIQRGILVTQDFLSGRSQRELSETLGFSTGTISNDRRKLIDDLRYLASGTLLDQLVEKVSTGQSPDETDIRELLELATERLEAKLKRKVVDKQLGRQAAYTVMLPQTLVNPAVLAFLDEVAEPDDNELGWQEKALCAQTDPESFFPEKGGSTREAKKVCQSCEVRVECLEVALDNDERFGIWGGLSERERRKLKKRAI